MFAARLRGRGQTVWVLFWDEGICLGSWKTFSFCYVVGSLKYEKKGRKYKVNPGTVLLPDTGKI